jgi:heme/copper-type cytochrome/quinol oxidase subunit 2
MLKKLFQYSDLKTMLRINALSVVITLFCEIFVVFVFLNKATLPEVSKAKFAIYLIGLIAVSLFFIVSVALLVYFMVEMRKQRKKSS